MRRKMAQILTINSSMYIDGWMNDLDFYVIPMINHIDSSGFFAKTFKKKNFFQNCFKLIKNFFFTDFNEFIGKVKIYVFFIRVRPYDFSTRP